MDHQIFQNYILNINASNMIILIIFFEFYVLIQIFLFISLMFNLSLIFSLLFYINKLYLHYLFIKNKKYLFFTTRTKMEDKINENL
jgi:hypothetical protein